MLYQIELKKTALEELEKIPKNIRDSIRKAIKTRIAVDPHGFGKSLKGEWKGCYRLRVGDYRIIYKVKEQEVVVVIIKIGNRSNVYQ